MIDTKARVLVVDDERDIRDVLAEGMGAAFTVATARTGEEALGILLGPEGARPDILLLDHGLDDMEGTEIQQALKDHGIEIPVILMTGRSIANAVILASQLGAVDIIAKPFDTNEVIEAIERVLRQTQQRREHVSTRTDEEINLGEKIIGRGAAMLDVFHKIGLVARTPLTILITGETGTGKTLLAETIHKASDRRRGPFLDINCAGIPETLLEGELFGHEKGAYTGADRAREGYFEAAKGGTIFLDEIGDMTLATQVKLLKVLDSHQIIRLGSTKSTPVDVRIIAATHRNLAREVMEGRFRADLYYRLSVYPIHMPALRERPDDLEALVRHFLNRARFKPTLPAAEIAVDALEKLRAHAWPGNVRELENVIQRANIYSQSELILPEHIIFTDEIERFVVDVPLLQRQGRTLAMILAEAQTTAVRAALLKAQGDPARAAAILGIDTARLQHLKAELDG